ncbi:hypothetical protein AC579_9709 [Pseudocercospora musae]|uniref:Calcineurin-like phosphoesterase domain-containing protein n=1 Tax=Pseudocercospora musae TaxID=113226 RepID=A0A139I659_9PEZI|nr:hypothetical protein AC579_9709 [Pseudocercospora musae]
MGCMNSWRNTYRGSYSGTCYQVFLQRNLAWHATMDDYLMAIPASRQGGIRKNLDDGSISHLPSTQEHRSTEHGLLSVPYNHLKMLSFFLLAVILSFLAFSYAGPTHAGWKWRKPLRFTKEGTFQIAVFADLHFGENAWDPWGPEQDANSVLVMNRVLDAENQQLVVLNGDLITGENAYLSNSTATIDQIVGPIVRRGLPFATTYGNHDSQYNLSRDAIFAHEHRYRNSMTNPMIRGGDAGVTNYYLPVYPSKGGREPCLILWFFDSRGGFYFREQKANGDGVGQPDWVDQSVVEWFQQSNALLTQRYQRIIPSLAFVHIPTNASAALQTGPGVDPNTEPGINDDYPLAPQAQGWCPNGTDGGCDYGGQDTPFMQAITTTPGLMALFSGHDHGNTWCYKWDQLVPGMVVAGNGLNLCFNQHSGYGGYGTWTRGAREVLITEKKLGNCEIDTWIRLETGAVVGSVTLNSTYGNDSYPATPNTNSICSTCNYTNITPMPASKDDVLRNRAKSISGTRKAIWNGN